MRQCLLLMCFCIGTTFGATAPTARAAAPVENQASAQRVPGEYYVTFRSLRSPEQVGSLGSGLVLPNLMPTDRRSTSKLARALCARAGVKFVYVVVSESGMHRGFLMQGASDGVVAAIAKDPRVALVTASTKAATLDLN